MRILFFNSLFIGVSVGLFVAALSVGTTGVADVVVNVVPADKDSNSRTDVVVTVDIPGNDAVVIVAADTGSSSGTDVGLVRPGTDFDVALVLAVSCTLLQLLGGLRVH